LVKLATPLVRVINRHRTASHSIAFIYAHIISFSSFPLLLA